MNISKLFTKVAFRNTVFKFVLNIDTIQKIAKDFSAKQFDSWEKRDCEYCQTGKQCKRHRASDRVATTNRVIKVQGLKLDSNLDGVYMSKSDMFIMNHEANSCLIIDCPPLFNINAKPINDTWVRKIIPFTFGNFQRQNDFTIHQTIDVQSIFDHKNLTCSFGDRDDQNKQYFVLHYNYGAYNWELES